MIPGRSRRQGEIWRYQWVSASGERLHSRLLMPDSSAKRAAEGGDQLETIATKCGRIADSTRFQAFIFAVIVANAVALGLETYDGIDRDLGGALETANDVFLGIFVVEMTIRIAAFGRRPWDFFREGWNVFDFVTVFAAFLPGIRQNATLLRLARLLRVVRVVSVLPDLRVLVAGMARALPPIGSLAVLALLLIFVYGMVGWELFGDELPKEWGNVGEAMLTLFTVLTLEGWNDVLAQAREVHPQSWIFFVSFVLLASFLLINIVIAIIINSVEEARTAERLGELEHRIEEAEREGRAYDESAQIASRLEALRAALDDLERELAAADLHEHRQLVRERAGPLRASGRRGRGL
jgi:voltage-gated sodium channel